MTNKMRLLIALRDAGPRGLSKVELGQLGIKAWPARLHELEEDGHILRRDRSRFNTRSWWRVVLLVEAPEASTEVVDDGTDPLFEVPVAAPASALWDEAVA